MKTMAILFGIFLTQSALAMTKSDCLSGNFSACKEIFNKFGSSSDKNGAANIDKIYKVSPLPLR